LSSIPSPLDPSIYVSLAFLFGVAAQFRAMDGYAFLRRMLARIEPSLGILYAVALVTFIFSPFILNDVLVLILTPALIKYAREYKVDAAPLIVAEVTLTNVASALTPSGTHRTSSSGPRLGWASLRSSLERGLMSSLQQPSQRSRWLPSHGGSGVRGRRKDLSGAEPLLTISP
jgi:hypothetical protein